MQRVNALKLPSSKLSLVINHRYLFERKYETHWSIRIVSFDIMIFCLIFITMHSQVTSRAFLYQSSTNTISQPPFTCWLVHLSIYIYILNNINFHFSSTLNHIHILASSIHALSCFNPSLFMLSISNLYSKQCPRQASVLTVFLVL